MVSTEGPSGTESLSAIPTPTSANDTANSAAAGTELGSRHHGKIAASTNASSTVSNNMSAASTTSAGGLLTAPPTNSSGPAPRGNYSSLFGSNYSSAAEERPEAGLLFGKLRISLLALGVAVMGLAFAHL